MTNVYLRTTNDCPVKSMKSNRMPAASEKTPQTGATN
jgi:hypothetical protein